MNETKNIRVIDDFSSFMPAENMATWKISKNLMASKGELLTADFDSSSEDLVLSPELEGFYEIVLRLYKPDGLICGINIKLDNEPHFTFIQPSGYEENTEELKFKSVDMTGRKIIISQPDGFNVFLDSISFVPSAPESPYIGDLEIGGIVDFMSFSYNHQVRSPRDIERCMYLLKDAGFNTLYWHGTGRTCNYPTKIGTISSGDNRERSKCYGEFVKNFDAHRLACECAHKMDMKIYSWYRINNHGGGENCEKLGVHFSDLWLQHPEYHLVNRDGSRSFYLISFAHPEVRDYKAAISEEMVSFGSDGIFIDTQRHPGTTGYCEPAVTGFREKYGEDPFQLDENDERWLRHRASYFTLFMRDLRKRIKAVNPEAKVAIRLASHPFKCLKEGVDLNALIEEELIDILIPSGAVYFINYTLDPFLELTRGRKIKLLGGMSPYLPRGHDPGVKGEPVWPTATSLYVSGSDFYDLGKSFIEAGAEGLVFYESQSIVSRPPIRKAIQRLAGMKMSGN